MTTFICLGQAPIAGCGRILTDEERHYYSFICEGCTRKWSEAIDDWRRGGENRELDAMFGAEPPRLQ